MKDTFFLTRQILGYRLSSQKDSTEENALVKQFLSLSSLYIVADPNTTAKDWEAKEFGICTNEKTISLFIEQIDAEKYAIKVGAVLQNKAPMVKKVPSAMIQGIIADYAAKGFIDSVTICGKTPIKVEVSLSPFISGVKRESGSMIMTAVEPEPTPASAVDTRQDLKLVDDVKKVLSMPAAADRRKADPGQIFENFHTLLNKLIQVNALSMDDLDKVIGVPTGYTKQLCTNISSDSIPQKILINYLDYFGLREFLFIFKGQCSELSNKLKNNCQIDKYNIKTATIHTKERFKLISLQRGKDTNRVNVYRATFKSKSRELVTVVSSNYGLIIGKEYEIDGLSILNEGVVSNVSTRNAAETGASPIPSEEEEQAALEKIEKSEKEKKDKTPSQRQDSSNTTKDSRHTGRNRYIIETAEEKTEREKNEILAYIIKTKGCNSQEARKQFEPLEGHPDAIASFAKYLKDGKPGPYAVRGYTPKRLMHELHYSPYEAFCMLAALESNPKDTLQRLKYREKDPQYQNKGKN